MSAAHKARLMADPRFGGWAAGQQCPQDAPERPRSAQNAPEVPAQLPDQKNAPALDFGPGLETQTDPVAAAACQARAQPFDFAADARDRISALQPVQREVLVFGGKGFSVEETAAFLGVTYYTVQWQRKEVFRVLGVRNMAEAAVLGTKAGLL